MKKKWLIKLLCLALAMALFLTACASQSGNPPESKAQRTAHPALRIFQTAPASDRQNKEYFRRGMKQERRQKSEAVRRCGEQPRSHQRIHGKNYQGCNAPAKISAIMFKPPAVFYIHYIIIHYIIRR